MAADLALPVRYRLSEWQRGTVTNLFAALVRAAEDELRGHLLDRLPRDVPESLRAALASAALPLALPMLEAATLIADSQLLPLLLRRAEEHRLGGSLQEQGLLGTLAGDEDAGVAAEAMGLLIARNSRFDAFHEPLLGPFDLPADLRHRLLWTVAAALRRYLVHQHGVDAATADEALGACVAAALLTYDEGAGVEARAARLAGLLESGGRLDDALTMHTAEEGNLVLLLAALAARSGLSLAAAWELLGEEAGAALLLRAAGVAREAAGAIFFRLSGDSAAAARLDRFDALAEAEAARLVAPWRADPAYREAIAELAR